MLSADFEGVMCPMVTPFADDNIDEESLVALVDWLIDHDIDGLVPCGTTGEFASLSPSEYRTVVETTIEVADDRVPVVPGVSATDLSTVRERLAFAADLGTDGTLLTPPYFHGAPQPSGNEQFFRTAADASSLPILVYNIPTCTGGPVNASTLADLSDHDRILGLKDTSGDFDYFLKIARETPGEFLLLQGYDQLLVSGIHGGAAGGINALSNVLPEVFDDIVRIALAEDTEEAFTLEQRTIPPLFSLCPEYGFATIAKAGLVARDVINSGEVRPPLVPLPDEAQEQVAALVAEQVSIRHK